jgi:hypothetical protein
MNPKTPTRDKLEEENMKYAEEWGMEDKTPTKTTADLFIDAERTYKKMKDKTQTREEKIEAHTKVSINAFDKGVLLGKNQTLKDVYKIVCQECCDKIEKELGVDG